MTVGIGADVGRADLYIGAERFTGHISEEALPVVDEPSAVWGAGLGAMLAANIVFRSALGLGLPRHPRLSMWTLGDVPGGSGPADPGPIDVGRGWLIGAGGVGSSFAWWLQLIGVLGNWVVIDHERVDISNLNRSLGMFLADFVPGGDLSRFKADVAAELLGGAAFSKQWDDWAATDPATPDVLIAAANDFGVRGSLAAYSHPMSLTGATSSRWTADLHLYRAGRDGCIDCRHPQSSKPAFACSTSAVPTSDGGSRDAALSFLSGTAGLFAAAALMRLQNGELVEPGNHWQLHFAPSNRPIVANRYSCDGGRNHSLSKAIRTTLYGQTRWAQVL